MNFAITANTSLLLKRLDQVAVGLFILFPAMMAVGRAPADITLSLIGFLFLIHSSLKKDFTWLKQKWFLAFLGLWGWMIIRCLFAEQPLFGLERALPFIRYGLFAMAISHWLIRNSLVERWFYPVLVVSGMILAIDGLIQYGFGQDLFGNLSHSPTRLTAWFNSPIFGNVLYPFALLSFGWAAAYFFKIRTNLVRLLLGAVMLIPFIGVVVSGERSPLLLSGFGLFVMILLFEMRYRMIILPILAIHAVILGTIFINDDAVKNRQIQNTVQKLADFKSSDYGNVYQNTLLIAKDHWFFGIGTKHYRLYCQKPDYVAEPCLTHPHNIYLELWVENGLIGLCLFLAIIYFLFAKSIQNWRDWRQDCQFIGAFALLLAELWPVISTSSLFSSWGVMGLWLSVGLVNGWQRPTNE